MASVLCPAHHKPMRELPIIWAELLEDQPLKEAIVAGCNVHADCQGCIIQRGYVCELCKKEDHPTGTTARGFAYIIENPTQGPIPLL